SLRRGGIWREVATQPVQVKSEATKAISAPAKIPGDGTHTLLVYPSSRFYDGRGADRPWLQEAPDTMTQVSWDGWAEIPMETARKLGIKQGDIVSLASPNGKIELPAYLTESLHPGAVAVGMGQGHTYAGAYARGGAGAKDILLNVGANPMALLGGQPDAASGGLPYLQVKVAVSKTGGRR